MIRRPGLLRGAVAVTVVVVLAGACAAASPSPSPSPTAISAQTADAIAIGEVGSPGTVKVISTVLSTYGAESQGGAIVADGTTVWAVRLAGTFQPPSCGPYSATPHPCPSPATTALVLLDATTGAVIEETMPAPGASSPVATTSSSTTGPATAIIPWTAATPAPQPSLTAMVIPTGTPPCRARDLTGTAGWTGGGGAMLGGIGLTNVGAAPCVIDGPPKQLQLRSADALLDVAYSAVDQPTPGSRLTSVTPVLMRPEDEADADLIWSNWCAEMIPVVTAVLVTLPDGAGSITAGPTSPGPGIGSTPRCDDGSAPSTVQAWAFEAVAAPAPTEPPALPAEGLTLTLDVPTQVVAGQPLDYVVVLANPTAVPIPLSPCLAYEERLNVASGSIVADYLLNCAAVPMIAPGQQVSFAMVLDVPPSVLPSRDAGIVWALDPYGRQGFPPRGPAEKLPIDVVAP